ncbi:MAG: hypothetical protein ABIQ60_15455 [Burkholderiaceae bacterium]
MPPPTSADERRQRLELEQAAADRLSRLHGALELRAAVLALLLPRPPGAAEEAWRADSHAAPEADALRLHAAQLSGPQRLPWLETLVSRMRDQPIEARQSLLEATRRVIVANGGVRTIDRLHWLAMRQRLGERSASGSHAPSVTDLTQLPQSDVTAIATYTAFLSRMVPIDAGSSAGAPADAHANPNPRLSGPAWYEAVMAPWRQWAAIPTCSPPDNDALVHALRELQALPWMQRPILVRAWVGCAVAQSLDRRLSDSAADALRLTCALLDSPLPPPLARHYDAA